jgi:hypothetical protein
MTVRISNRRASSCLDTGFDVDVVVSDNSRVIRGTATVANDNSANWASCPDQWLSSELLDYVLDISDAIRAA